MIHVQYLRSWFASRVPAVIPRTAWNLYGLTSQKLHNPRSAPGACRQCSSSSNFSRTSPQQPFDLVSEFDRAVWLEIGGDIKVMLPAAAAFSQERRVAAVLPAA